MNSFWLKSSPLVALLWVPALVVGEVSRSDEGLRLGHDLENLLGTTASADLARVPNSECSTSKTANC